MATQPATTHFEQDLLDRGYSRRQLAKAAALLGAATATLRATGAAAQQA
ncbi:MAG: aminotransferase, partial [Sphingobium sp.]